MLRLEYVFRKLPIQQCEVDIESNKNNETLELTQPGSRVMWIVFGLI